MTKQPDDVDEDAGVLAGLALEAWSPPPLADQADAVVARMRVPGGVPAAETVQVQLPGRWFLRPRTWIAVGAGLAAVASVAIVLTSVGDRTHAVAPGALAGEVRAVRAEHVVLGASSGELDPGASVQWRREGSRVIVTQRQGRATWRVDPADTLVIETGAMVASVEATGASLRVEVEMNMTDAKILGASATTAAAVAVVTVLVYQGHVNVTGQGQTLVVPAGGTVEVEPGAAPKLQDMIAQHETLRQRNAELERELVAARIELDVAAGDLGRQVVASTMAGLRSQLELCDNGSAGSTLELEVRVAASGTVAFAEVSPPVSFARCLVTLMEQTTFPRTRRGGTFTWPLATRRTSPRSVTPVAPAACDADALASAGQQHMSRGETAAAFGKFHAAYVCSPSSNRANMAFLSACVSRNESMARRYYPKISQLSLSQRCRVLGVAFE